MSEQNTLPKGFETGAQETFQFRSSEVKNNAPAVNFNGRRRMGSGALGQAVEKPKDASQTLVRLFTYLGT